ncbi:MAG: glycosyltransferase N-terminal domain-containing protein [Hyphomicrobium sp.]
MAISKTTFTRFAGRSLARLIGHVGKTSDIAYDPPDLMSRLGATHPCIVACWHGQFMMLSMLRPPGARIAAMVARHGDAELIGEAMIAFDVTLIRGAGAGTRKKDRGGASALRASVRALGEGLSLVMTADVPPGPARQAGIGIIMIAQMTGRPIIPVAAATSRFTSFDTWSRMTVNLPYSKLAFAGGEPIFVPRDADAAALEGFRLQLETSLDETMARAYRLAGADLSKATPLEHLAARNPPAPGLPLKIYRSGLSALRPMAPLLLKYRARQGKEDQTRKSERLGRPKRSRPAGKLVWVHAASVGETNVALPLIEKMLERDTLLNVMMTTGTTTSAELAARRLPPRAFHQFIPLDAAEYVAAFLDHWKPDLAIYTESEIWPNLVLATSERAIPMALINARMSPRSMKRWRRHARHARPLFSRFSLVLAQNDRVARVLRFLGAPRVIAAGNLKIDAPPPPVDAEVLARLEAATAGRPLLLAASTHPGEDRIVAEAHTAMRAALPDLLTIIVPRHPGRADAIRSELAGMGLSITRRSETSAPADATDIYIADTIGELGTFFKLCSVAFIGGSLIPHGGQNPIEAVRHGAVVLTGPHTHNFQDAYAALERSKGTVVVTSASELAAAATSFLNNETRRIEARKGADAALATLSGAMARTLDELAPYLDRPEKDARAD